MGADQRVSSRYPPASLRQSRSATPQNIARVFDWIKLPRGYVTRTCDLTVATGVWPRGC